MKFLPENSSLDSPLDDAPPLYKLLCGFTKKLSNARHDVSYHVLGHFTCNEAGAAGLFSKCHAAGAALGTTRETPLDQSRSYDILLSD